MTTTTTQTTRSLKIEGIATALSSISHLDGQTGTIGLFHREKIAQPDGTIAQVPVISGNALRGLLRDRCADVFWRALGQPELPAPIFDLLWSGGSLAKAGAGHVLSARQLIRVRQLIPMVSLFGGSGAGRIIEGKLRVLKLTPICAETAHILPPGVVTDDATPPRCRDLLQVEEFTRRDDAKRPELAPAIEGMTPRALPPGDTSPEGLFPTVGDDTPDRLDRVMQMRYGVETLAAGTRLHWGMSVRHATDPEIALLAAGIDSWLADGGHIGGRSSTGHGRLRLDVHQWETVTPTITVGEALAVTGQDDLAAHVTAHRDEILETLSWFT